MSEQPPTGPREPADSGLPSQQQPGWYFDPNGLPVMLNVPGPQPQVPRARRRPRNRKTRNALIGIGSLVAIIVAVTVVTARNSSSTGNAAATSSLSATPSAVATASPSGCAGQAISWRDNGGGLSQLQAVITDMGHVQSAASALGTDLSAGRDASRDETSLKTATVSLQSDAQTAQANPPPSCVPHLRADESAALTNASKAALNCETAISELGSANYNVAVSDIEAATAAIATSGEKFQDATSDVQHSTTGN